MTTNAQTNKTQSKKKLEEMGVQRCSGVHESNDIGTASLGSAGSPLCLLLLQKKGYGNCSGVPESNALGPKYLSPK